MNYKSVLILLVLAFALLAVGCARQAPLTSEEAWDKPRNYCETDEDCICGGVDKQTGICFMGNKKYHELYVDKDAECHFDEFCTGPGDNLVMRCMVNECIQMFECLEDYKCGEGEKCVRNKCVQS